MLAKIGVDNLEWTLSINKNVIHSTEAVDGPTDIVALAIIVHLLKEILVVINNENLEYFRMNLTLALYHDTSIL